MGGHDVIIKKIEMDRMNESDAREVIRWEAEQHVPFDIKSVELDFQILDPLGEGLQMQVLLVAAKRELVDHKVSLLLDAGLSPAAIEVDAFALHNAFSYNHPEAMKGIVVLVNIGHETTNVNILENGNPLLTRDIPYGSRRVRQDLQREKGLTAEQAEDVVQGREPLDDLSSLVASAADEVGVGIERASAFLMTRQDGGGLGSVFLSGGGARIPGMADALGSHLHQGHPVRAPQGSAPLPGRQRGLDVCYQGRAGPVCKQHRLGCGNLRRWEFRYPPPGEHPNNYGGCLCRGEADRYHGRGRCGCDRRSKERRAQPPSVEALTPA